MEHKKLFRPFRLRLFSQALGHGALLGLTFGAAAVFLTSLVYHILLKPGDPMVLLIAFGSGFLLGLLPYLILHLPTDQKVAKALDQTGLQERAGTMLAYRKEDGTLIKLQRQDALTHIGETAPGKLAFRPVGKKLIAAGVAVVLAAVMILLPADLFAPRSDVDPEEAAQIQAVNDLITQLRQEVLEAQLEEELKAELQAIIDQLEKDLYASTSELDRAALLEQARQAMNDAVVVTLSHYQIGKALQQYTMTESLGTYVREGDSGHIPRALDDLQQKVEEATRQITRLRTNISSALTDSGTENTDSLYIAFDNFTKDLEGYRDSSEVWVEELGGYVDMGYGGDLTSIFDAAEAAILQALDEQAHTESEMEDANRLLEQGFQPSTPSSGEQTEIFVGDDTEGDSQGGGGGSSNMQPGSAGEGGSNVGGLSDGEGSSERTAMLEGIYDPVSGNVTYGEVFAAYYAEYLAALETGEIPEDLRILFERYFSALS